MDLLVYEFDVLLEMFFRLQLTTVEGCQITVRTFNVEVSGHI